MKLKIAIVDDEELARGLLREYLSAYDDIEIVGECANGFEAVKTVAELKPDLLLLDIQMPRLDGFEVLELVGLDDAAVGVFGADLVLELRAVLPRLLVAERQQLERALVSPLRPLDQLLVDIPVAHPALDLRCPIRGGHATRQGMRVRARHERLGGLLR